MGDAIPKKSGSSSLFELICRQLVNTGIDTTYTLLIGGKDTEDGSASSTGAEGSACMSTILLTSPATLEDCPFSTAKILFARDMI